MVEMNSIINFLNSFAPPCLAEDYDNVGLLVGDKNKEVCRVLIALDVDEYVLEDADKKSCDLVITHHPLIFKPLKRIDTEDSVSRSIIKLIKNDISLISVHTNFDSVKSGLCDMFLDKIADVSTRAAIDGDEYNGAGRIGDLKNESTFEEIIKRVKKEFEIDKIRYVGKNDRKIKKIAVCNGGGADYIYAAKKLGADLYISGDFKYHHARFAYENDICILDVPHYKAEIMFCEYLKELLKNKFNQEIEVFLTDKNIDVWKEF